MRKNTEDRLEQAVARRLSVEASCDPRTIQRVFRGEDVRGMSGERAKTVLHKHGLIPRPGSIDRSNCAGPSFYTRAKRKELLKQDEQALDPAHGAEPSASWASLRSANSWTDPQ